MIYDFRSPQYLRFLRGSGLNKTELNGKKLRANDFEKGGFGDDGRGG